MNGLFLVIISALVFVLAYRFYGAFIATKVLAVNQYKVTPAFRFEDGHDYVPTNKYVVSVITSQPLPVPVLWSVLSLLLSSGTYPAHCGFLSAAF